MGNFNRDDRGGRRSFNRRDSGRGGDRPMHQAICDNCGKECEVPFRPTTGKPVFCSDCFKKRDTGSDSRRFEPRNRAPEPQNMAVINAMNAKLDRILKLVEETKAPKVKKETKKPASPKKK